MTIRTVLFLMFCFVIGSVGIIAGLAAICWVAAGGMTWQAWGACGLLGTLVFAYSLVFKLGYDLLKAR